MNFLLAAPLLIPLAGGVLAILGRRSLAFQKALAVLGMAALLAVAVRLLLEVRENGIQTANIGNWQAPFGITVVVDLFSAIMLTLAAIIGLAVAVYSLVSVDETRMRFGYFPLLHFLLMGICGAFVTGDIFNLYVWFEVLLISSFVLIALGSERPQIEGAIKYVTLNLISSAVFVAGVGILYGMTGTLNMADLALKSENTTQSGLLTTVGALFLVAFGIKAAIFPFFFWLPSSYHTPPVAVSAIFSGLLTKVGVYALFRVFTLIFVNDVAYTHWLILVLASVTMLTGVLGAASQFEMRRILSFHIISQIGYMLLGLALFTPLGLAGGIFYIIHHIIVKTNLFLVSGVVHRLRGSYDLKYLGGLWRPYPLLGLLFLIPAFSLAGVPPLSGFFAKFLLVQAGLESGQYLVIAITLVVSILTLYSMTKIWAEAFWKAPPEAPLPSAPARATLALMLAPIVALAGVTIAIGVAPGVVFDMAQEAARQLLDPTEYIAAVLERQP